VNTKFVNFQDNSTRKSGAISYLLYTSFPTRLDNSVEKLTFENAKPVYFPPTDRRWSFSGEFGTFAGWNGVGIHDIDGSLSGVADSYVVIDNGIADASNDKNCRIEPTWNAAVCKGDVGRVSITAGGGGGGRGGGAPGGAPAGPGGAGGRGGAPGPAAGGLVGPVAGNNLVAVAQGPPAGGAPRGGGAPGGAPGGGGGRGGAGATPIVLSRNDRKFTPTGATNVLSGTEIKAETEAPSVSISLTDMDSGSWVIFELPGFNTAATGTAQNSLDALRSATTTSYYKGDGALWVKVVSSGAGARGGGGGRGGAASAVQVSR